MKLGISKEQCLRLVKAEGDSEVGAGLLARDPYPYSEEDCPGHIASDDAKICRLCGTHIDSLRPDDGQP